MTHPLRAFPVCSICKQPVRLETAKTDEKGQAVHEDCYLQRLMASLQYSPPRITPNSNTRLWWSKLTSLAL